MLDFRLATKDDIPILLQLMADFYAIDQYPFHKSKTEQNLNTLLANPALGLLCIIQWEGQSIGYACLTFGFSFEYGGRNAFIDELYLVPGYRKQGLGKKTLMFIEAQAKLHGVQTLHLEVEHHNEGGRRLYTGEGFKDSGRHLFVKRL